MDTKQLVVGRYPKPQKKVFFPIGFYAKVGSNWFEKYMKKVLLKNQPWPKIWIRELFELFWVILGPLNFTIYVREKNDLKMEMFFWDRISWIFLQTKNP